MTLAEFRRYGRMAADRKQAEWIARAIAHRAAGTDDKHWKRWLDDQAQR